MDRTLTTDPYYSGVFGELENFGADKVLFVKESNLGTLDIKANQTWEQYCVDIQETVDFCNFVANKFNIDLNLEPLESEDEGELIFDFRQNHSEVEISDIFNSLNLKGKVNGCSAYENLLILLEANSQRNGSLLSRDNRKSRW